MKLRTVILFLSLIGIALLILILLRETLPEETRLPINTLSNSNNTPFRSGEGETPKLTADVGGASSSEEYSVVADSIAANHSKERNAFLTRLEPLFGSKEKKRGVLYGMVLESLDKESVPFLRELLRDESYKDRWNQIALMIAMLSEKDDKESVIAILNYIRRPNTWPSDDRYSIIGDTVKKGATLKNLGLFDSSLVGETLRNAFTEEGAEKLIRPWADTQGTVDPLQLAMITRSWAAKGLVLTRDPVNVALVSESYEALAHTMLSSEYKKREASPELLLDVERHLAFCEGMADNEMLSEMGVEGFLRLRDDGHAFSSEKSRVLTKYMGEWFDDYRMVLSSCPICGKLAE